MNQLSKIAGVKINGKTAFYIIALLIVGLAIYCHELLGGGTSRTSSSTSNSSISQGQSAESFIAQVVSHGAGVPGSASVQCGDEENGEIEFSGTFTWRDAPQYQTFQGTLSGGPGSWHVDSISYSDPVEQ